MSYNNEEAMTAFKKALEQRALLYGSNNLLSPDSQGVNSGRRPGEDTGFTVGNVLSASKDVIPDPELEESISSSSTEDEEDSNDQLPAGKMLGGDPSSGQLPDNITASKPLGKKKRGNFFDNAKSAGRLSLWEGGGKNPTINNWTANPSMSFMNRLANSTTVKPPTEEQMKKMSRADMLRLRHLAMMQQQARRGFGGPVGALNIALGAHNQPALRMNRFGQMELHISTLN